MKNIEKSRLLGKENVLEIECAKVFDCYAVRIKYQNEEVFKRGIFVDKELRVGSTTYFDFFCDYLSLRGIASEFDNDCIVLNEEDFEKLIDIVEKLNEKYGIPKRWRAKYGGEYYYVNEYLEVIYGLELNSDKDKRLYNIGNYFRCKEDAEKYINKLKDVFKEEL